MPNDLRTFLVSGIAQHPRIAQQKLFSTLEESRLLDQLAPLPSFRRDYAGGLAILDWDHRLPCTKMILRILGYYSDATLSAGRDQFKKRQQEIIHQNRFPEFDVPDFASLFAEDSYECEVPITGQVGKLRLVSAWRREIEDSDSRRAAEIALESDEYADIVEAVGFRPAHLGELEAVSWIPPCESDLAIWSVDVWYLLSFDGRVGTGKSFLVDLDENRVVSVRDFSVRTN